MSRMTKAELEEQVKQLKEKVKELLKEKKESLLVFNDDLGDKPYRAIGLFFEDKTYKFAHIDYNPENKFSKIVKIEDASRVPHSADLAKFNLEEATQELVFGPLEK